MGTPKGKPSIRCRSAAPSLADDAGSRAVDKHTGAPPGLEWVRSPLTHLISRVGTRLSPESRNPSPVFALVVHEFTPNYETARAGAWLAELTYFDTKLALASASARSGSRSFSTTSRSISVAVAIRYGARSPQLSAVAVTTHATGHAAYVPSRWHLSRARKAQRA